jgi:steroid 5-alpha reductase family enzyme
LRRILIVIMAGGWSFRLADYLLVNRVIGKPEDGRYQRLRTHWREHTNSNFSASFRRRRCSPPSSRFPFSSWP